MLKKRIIVTLLHDGKGLAVKPVSFQKPMRIVGSLMQTIKVMARRDIDELVLIDICATPEGRTVDFEKIKEYAAELYCPLTIGGGISKSEHIREALNNGADKVLIGSAFQMDWARAAAHKFGAQCIVYALDIGLWVHHPVNEMIISEAIKGIEDQGAGEIILTDMDQDGTQRGYNIDMARCVLDYANVPVVINGGCGTPEHMFEALNCHVAAHAVAASTMFLYTDVTPKDCSEYLKKKGVPVR